MATAAMASQISDHKTLAIMHKSSACSSHQEFTKRGYERVRTFRILTSTLLGTTAIRVTY